MTASRLLDRDPTLAVLAFAVWSALSGASFLGPGNNFVLGISYHALAQLPISENTWGGAQVVDALLLTWTAFRGRLELRAAVALLSAAMWMFFGCMVVLGGYQKGVFSAVGSWGLVLGFGLIAAAIQWVKHAQTMPTPPSYEEPEPWN